MQLKLPPPKKKKKKNASKVLYKIIQTASGLCFGNARPSLLIEGYDVSIKGFSISKYNVCLSILRSCSAIKVQYDMWIPTGTVFKICPERKLKSFKPLETDIYI
jgi:hypothetical protein